MEGHSASDRTDQCECVVKSIYAGSDNNMSTRNYIVEQAVQAAKNKRRRFGYLFYGDSQKDLQCKPVPQLPGITTLLELFAVLEKCWRKETAYSIGLIILK